MNRPVLWLTLGLTALAALVLSPWFWPAAANGADRARLDHYSFTESSTEQWKLPSRLREISGLAMTPDQRLLAHGDEQGVIYELDYTDGDLVKAFALSDGQVVYDDFEGIATIGPWVYLVNSNGRIYQAVEGADGEHVLFNTYHTGVGARCEVEGLAADRQQERLFLACKTPRDSALEGYITVFVWSLQRQALETGQTIQSPLAPVLKQLGAKHFRPAGIEWDDQREHLILIGSRQQALVELNTRGTLIAVRRLQLPDRHRQTEGIALARDGRLFLSDEGDNRKARLAIYRPDKP